LEDPGDTEQVLGSLTPGQVAPTTLECASRHADCLVDVLDVRPCYLGDRLFSRRVERREPLTALGGNFFAADEQPVAGLELNDLARLGRGRVLPGDRLTVAETPGRRRLRAAANVSGLAARYQCALAGFVTLPLCHVLSADYTEWSLLSPTTR
jgi:hypothetical protein